MLELCDKCLVSVNCLVLHSMFHRFYALSDNRLVWHGLNFKVKEKSAALWFEVCWTRKKRNHVYKFHESA